MNETLALIDRSSNFTVSLLSPDERWGDEHLSRTVHDTVLRPLLLVADECWAYGIDVGSEVWSVASDMLIRERGKFRVTLAGEPISGKEFFWNASGGKRGTIAIVVPVSRFDGPRLFRACRDAWVFTNYRSGHTPAAITFAHSRISQSTHVVLCLPRNNGLEWMELFAPKPLVFELFHAAKAVCRPPLGAA